MQTINLQKLKIKQMSTKHKVLMYIKKELFNSIARNTNHPWHMLAVHECIDSIDVYYIRA